MLQQPKVPWLQETATNLLPTQGQQSQSQLPQQQLMSQIQSLPTQFQQQLDLQEQSNPLQQDLLPRLQASSQAPASLLQQQIVIDQQKQLYQSQRPLPETSSTSLHLTAQTIHANRGDWQEEVYQKDNVANPVQSNSSVCSNELQVQQNRMDPNDWRVHWRPDSREGIINKIIETLKRHVLFSGEEGLLELKKIAERFEEKIYVHAIIKSGYERKISFKMLTMEIKPKK
ncbi:mediator of RNA polymerase II transcription subunit 15a isoform X1 [Hevea brasiliensis]|uniref:mediator of RNA polymerase II transcription subunit 15a isoform X1 n=1 Tax=Hevea brasiliensis TaxID=3981 RepID=UPI0025DC27D7|nr:mediator of RNA polymerase II transcription subunit 15a isoform X1 [Hevea brasiliensis]XP_058004760.1 mediator of RNA polymerase II transcription subunit 15a isoform X1 [Hevea brasiliensis]XP_058004761.1 mediator of RNA polymerase II transcription subunit 15a isoform X1 [Hevea brasiliensis]XP_058004762.1 mediator of RNA polymerase II transcription subunit 15a isoform X1 [Hevea brasiliensis]XP_058004763.1 mediator of RNA polymerase II transcription subunit 15a isoform X1 [Hevea brasiliensis]